MTKPESEAMQHFRERVRKLLELRNMTITQLAIESDLPREHLSRILGGKHDPSIPYAEAIAKALNVDLIDLLCEKKDKKTA